MRNLFKITFLLLSYIILTGSQNQSGGCATANPNIVYPSITSSIGSFIVDDKYRKIAILPFWDAPNSPGTGRLMQGITTNVFLKFRFDVVERGRIDEVLKEQVLSLSGVLEERNRIKIGRILGVNAIVVGELGQYESQQRKTDTTYFPWTDFYTGQTSYIPIQGQQWLENYVSVSLRIVDVETGKVIFAGAGQFERGLTNPPQQLAEVLISEILSDWFDSPGRLGIYFGKEFIIDRVIVGSPASKAGIKAGDKILKWNGIDFSNIQNPEEYQRITYGYPRERVELEILRGDKVLKFTLIRVSKYLIKE